MSLLVDRTSSWNATSRKPNFQLVAFHEMALSTSSDIRRGVRLPEENGSSLVAALYGRRKTNKCDSVWVKVKVSFLRARSPRERDDGACLHSLIPSNGPHQLLRRDSCASFRLGPHHPPSSSCGNVQLGNSSPPVSLHGLRGRAHGGGREGLKCQTWLGVGINKQRAGWQEWAPLPRFNSLLVRAKPSALNAADGECQRILALEALTHRNSITAQSCYRAAGPVPSQRHSEE
ncbi:unnamed protein product [Leuciscus chuanchicus]